MPHKVVYIVQLFKSHRRLRFIGQVAAVGAGGWVVPTRKIVARISWLEFSRHRRRTSYYIAFFFLLLMMFCFAYRYMQTTRLRVGHDWQYINILNYRDRCTQLYLKKYSQKTVFYSIIPSRICYAFEQQYFYILRESEKYKFCRYLLVFFSPSASRLQHSITVVDVKNAVSYTFFQTSRN